MTTDHGIFSLLWQQNTGIGRLILLLLFALGSAAAAALARDGFVALAERMADELAFSLAARARLHRELRRAGAVSPDDADLLRGAWASATAMLWRARVETGLRRVADQRGRMDRALALLGPASPPGA